MIPRRSAAIYLGLGAVFVCSLIAALVLPAGRIVTDLIALPGGVALIGAVWQLFRDEAAHERALDLKQRDHFFNLSVTSHMAKVAFDKHAAFCEEYVARVNRGVGELFREGPSKNAMAIGQDLALIRQKHAPWVPAEVLERLKPFEEAVWKVGTTAVYLADAPGASDRHTCIDDMYKTFSQVLGFAYKDAEERPEIRIDQIILHMQFVLGVTELHRLRTAIVREAITSVEG